MKIILCCLPLLLALSGCLTPKNETPPVSAMVFDQREFRMPGEKYREWPPDAPSATIWREKSESSFKPYRPQHFDLFENRTARYNYFRSAGKPVADICVISCTSASNHVARALGLTYQLMRAHRNVELFDEQYIAKRGSSFASDMAGYGAVVVSQTEAIHISTVALLVRFAQKGGIVLFDRAYPQAVEGIENPTMLKTLIDTARLVPNGEWREALASCAPPLFMLEGTDIERVETALRAVQGGHTLELTNTLWHKPQTVTLYLADTPARAALLNPVSGRTLVLRPEEDGSYIITLAPRQTWIVCYGKLAKNFVFDGFYSPPGPRREIAKLDSAWHGGRFHRNVFMLREGSVTQPSEDSDTFRLRYAVTVEDIPDVCELAIEIPKEYITSTSITHTGDGSFISTDVEAPTITVNGQPVLSPAIEFLRLVGGHHTFFYTADISTLFTEVEDENGFYLLVDGYQLLTTGENEIEISSHTVEFENAYLLGDFAVNPSRTAIVKENNTFVLGDLAEQGYPLYSGEFVLTTTVDLPNLSRDMRYLLTFQTFDAVVLHVMVNGVIFDPIIAQPWETDISAALRPGTNTVSLMLENRTYNNVNGFFGDLKNPTPFGLLTPPVIVEEPRGKRGS